MGATMETQPTQHGLMKNFTGQGLATDNLLAASEEKNSDTKGFAGLLSGYSSGAGEQSLNGINSNQLPLQQMSDSGDHSLNFADVADESLPLLGQVLPLDLIDPPIILSAELPNKLTDEDLLASSNIDSVSGDVAIQLLEDRGFYAQSLVSSLIGSGAIPGSGIDVSTPIKLNNIHTASELDAMGDEATDRFLGSESLLTPLKSKKSVTLESMTVSQSIAPLITPTALQSQVSLALALNEDPTTQSLGDLIDGEALEKGEFETKLNTLERKQDDQTLKLSKGQQAWGDAITERITMNAAKDIKQVTIHLDPPELGSLELKLQIKDDQQTHVQVQVQNSQVKEALESSAQRLREMLASQGLELSEFDVQTDSGRGESSEYGSDDQDQGQLQNSDTSPHSAEEMSIEIPKAKNNNLLDTFV
jgi:flagellar hook-length control protein FliK